MSFSNLYLLPNFIRTPSQNGVGRYVCQLQRVVLKFCKNRGASRGVREFVEYDLLDYAKDNPSVVVYLKPRRHKTAVIKAEYLNGDIQTVFCHNYSRDEVVKWMHLLKTQAGNHEGQRYRKLQLTNHPSIQGPWTPFTFRDPAMNLLEFPNQDVGQALDQPRTATEELIEIFERQRLEEGQQKNLEQS